MAVKYVNEFSFPSDFGFHKNGSASVPGKDRGGKISTPQAYRKGGAVGEEKRTPAPATKGSGAGKLSEKTGTDKAPPATRTEVTSGVQKPAFASGGHAKGCSCKMCSGGMIKKAEGGKVAHGKQWDGEKKPWNKDDGTSPGSAKRTAPGQGTKNQAAARDKFATDGENTEPATKQTGDVERMSGYSDFKRGGKVHKKARGGHATTPQRYAKGGKVGADRYETEGVEKAEHVSDGTSARGKGDGKEFSKGGHNRIKNLGHYAHGGKVHASGSEKAVKADKYERAAGTPKVTKEPRGEKPSGHATGKHTEKAQGEKRMASGGLGRATSPKKNAAIHAKMKHNGPKGGAALGALASALGGAGPMGAAHQPSAPGMGPPPPGLAPGMGSPPGGQVGGMAPPPGGAMGPGGMAHGGGVKHVIVHHVSHKA